MDIKFKKSELVDIINEEIDRLAARTYTEDGVSLFDSIRITSRDTRVQARLLDERDARLRSIIAFCLGGRDRESEIGLQGGVVDAYIVYEVLPEKLSKAPSQNLLTTLLRKYLVDSVLCDWYIKHSIDAPVSPEIIEALESKIVYTLRQGFARKPMQPFGPKF